MNSPNEFQMEKNKKYYPQIRMTQVTDDMLRYNPFMDDIMAQNIIKAASDYNAEKKKIVLRRLEIRGITIDLKEEAQKRFPLLMSEKQGNRETIWYNDGTREGLRVVTFVYDEKGPYPSTTTDLGYAFTTSWRCY